MDTMIQSYMEETEDMLQKAEECIIRLEVEYSSADVNELFRIAHTIKGSSHMVGYEDIGNVMHRIEDMLDCARNGTILFDQNIVSLCFEGLDVVKKMLQFKMDPSSTEMMEGYLQEALGISERVEGFIKANKKVNKKESETLDTKQQEMGIISTLLNKEPKGKNKYYVTFILEEDVPMISPVLMIILKSIEDIGSLVYSSVTDYQLTECKNENEMKTFNIILCTDIDEAELYTYFALFYVEKVNIINLTRSIHEVNDYCFNETDHTSYVVVLRVMMKIYNLVFSRTKEVNGDRKERGIIKDLRSEVIDAFDRMKNKEKTTAMIKEINEVLDRIMKLYDGKVKTGNKLRESTQSEVVNLIEKLYNEVKGKYVVRIFKSEQENFIPRLRNFIGMVNRSATLMILIDISNLPILQEHELRNLIEIKKELQEQGIETGMIAKGLRARRLVNIFDSIKSVEDFLVSESELDAILGMFQVDDSFMRINKKIKHMLLEE